MQHVTPRFPFYLVSFVSLLSQSILHTLNAQPSELAQSPLCYPRFLGFTVLLPWGAHLWLLSGALRSAPPRPNSSFCAAQLGFPAVLSQPQGYRRGQAVGSKEAQSSCPLDIHFRGGYSQTTGQRSLKGKDPAEKTQILQAEVCFYQIKNHNTLQRKSRVG